MRAKARGQRKTSLHFRTQKLLDFINEWDQEHDFQTGKMGDGWLVHVTIEALADAFGKVFREVVLPEDHRVRFWLDSKEKIARTISLKAY